MKPYTLAEARFILSHVYCVHHVPEGKGGFVYNWAPGAGGRVTRFEVQER